MAPSILFNQKQRVTFQCVGDFRLGAYTLKFDEPILAVSDGQGRFRIFTEWSNGQSLGTYSANIVNKLAGEILVQ